MAYRWSNKFLDYYPRSMKLLSYPWVGHDSIDGVTLREKGIALCNVGNVSAPDVADMALYLTLACYRMTPVMEKTLRETGEVHKLRSFIGGKKFDSVTGMPDTVDQGKLVSELTIGGKMLSSPRGHVLGIVGLGSIGKEIAKRLWAIGMTIKYTKRTPLTQEEQLKLPYETEFYENFESLLPNCDLIVLLVPGSLETKHLINSTTIKLLKPGARIVNIGRGSAIDEDVLLQLLDDGTVTSAGLDVFATEPLVDKRLLSRWDVVMTPHIGSATTDNTIASHEISMDNIINVLLENGPGLFPVN